jgi:rhamnosyltransferase
MTNSNVRLIGIIVTFYPDLTRMAELTARLRPQLDALIVVDNGSAAEVKTWVEARPELTGLFLGENQGIAAAQNRGIAWARAQGATHVMLFDQDSLPAPDMVMRLREAEAQLRADGVKIGALGPRFLDARQNNPPCFVRTEGLRLRRFGGDGEKGIVPTDYVIASGSLIPVTTLDVVGLMLEPLFIDYVDIEWGLRAKRLGYGSYGVCEALMEHSLGDKPASFFGRKIPLHSALRHYYLFRNRVWLYKAPGLPLNWRVVDAVKLLRNFIFYALYAEGRVRHIKGMLLGVRDGLRNRLGRFEGVL